MIKNKLIFLYLYISVWIKTILFKICRIFVNITEVQIKEKDNKFPRSYLVRYYIVKLLSYFIRFLKYFYLSYVARIFQFITKYIDMPADKIQINKNYKEGSQIMIFNTHSFNCFEYIINKIDNLKLSKNNMNKQIFLKFQLHTKDKTTCLKKYLIMYKDNNHNYDHTLQNILLFNNIQVDDDAYISIGYFRDRKIVLKQLPYKDVCNKHITVFDNMDDIENV